MSISAAEAQKITKEFTATYPRATDLAFKFRSTAHGLYGARARDVPAGMLGGYSPIPFTHQGRHFLGRMDVHLGNAKDANDLRQTLRHELIGHFGINTFAPDDKRALLDTLIAHRHEPSLKPHWDSVERAYAGRPLDIRAEEVFCRRAETVAPHDHLARPDIAEAGRRAFDDTVRDRARPMQVQDLDRIVLMVAQGLHDRSRVQQTFPEHGSERLVALADPRQATLRAEALMIAGRLGQLDGPGATSPFRHPELTRHYRQEQRRPAIERVPDQDRGR